MRVRQTTLLAALVILATQAGAQEEAFKVDKRSFKKTYPTIALAPVEADPYLEMPDRVAAILEEEITARLTREKFNVIPSSVLGGIRSQMEAQVGGIADPETGNTDAAKLQAVRSHAFRELWFREQFDALGIIRVSITRVPIENDRVEWDGVKQRIQREGRAGNYTANIAVTSVSLALFDSINEPIYTWYGGLEPLMWRNGDQLEALTPDKLFLDEKLVREAAELAVKPF